jgi:AAA domain
VTFHLFSRLFSAFVNYQTTVAGAIGFGFVHQCRSIYAQGSNGDDDDNQNTSNAKVLACAFSNVGADNLAEAFQRLGLNVLRVGRASAVSESLWNSTMDAAIDRDPHAQLALQNAAKVTAQLANLRQGRDKPGRGAQNGSSGGERMLRQAATLAVEASIQACNLAATRALRQADVIVSTCTGAADPRLLAACGIYASDADDLSKLKNDWNGGDADNSINTSSNTLIRGNAPDGLPPLSLPYVIVDEACQSVEPGILIPLVSTNSCRSLVMLGDPCQLPPTVRSSSSSPLSISLMERLAALLPHPSVRLSAPSHQSDQNDAIEYLDSLPIKQARSHLHTMERERKASYRKRYSGSFLLSVQYRMHPSIAAFPSAIFYDGLLSTPAWMADARAFPVALRRLMPCADPRLCVRMVDVGGRGNERRGNPSLERTTRGTSLVGVDEQTSYWNEPEAQRLVDLVKELLMASDPGIQSIGVISPYNAQVSLIRSMLETDAEIQALLQRKIAPCPTIEVKSVDGYQGR